MLSELGEFGLIEFIQKSVTKSRNAHFASWKHLLVDTGDDAAAWQSNSHIQMATTDTMVQDTHFDLRFITWEELGYKAMAVNLSDIAAMGGMPEYALISLALPGELDVEAIHKLINSMIHLAGEFGVAIVGGNLAAAPNIVITITIIGCSKGKTLLRRSTASPGNQIAVTGHLGLSAAGLEMLKGKASLNPETSDFLRRAHVQPIPRIKEGQILVECGVNTAIDISDGLIADLNHICESSKVNARIELERIPIHPSIKANFSNYKQLALHGGEDYELLFIADKTIITRVKQALNCPVTVIGDITEEESPQRVIIIDSKGKAISCKKGGWEHFKNGIL